MKTFFILLLMVPICVQAQSYRYKDLDKIIDDLRIYEERAHPNWTCFENSNTGGIIYLTNQQLYVGGGPGTGKCLMRDPTFLRSIKNSGKRGFQNLNSINFQDQKLLKLLTGFSIEAANAPCYCEVWNGSGVYVLIVRKDLTERDIEKGIRIFAMNDSGNVFSFKVQHFERAAAETFQASLQTFRNFLLSVFKTQNSTTQLYALGKVGAVTKDNNDYWFYSFSDLRISRQFEIEENISSLQKKGVYGKLVKVPTDYVKNNWENIIMQSVFDDEHWRKHFNTRPTLIFTKYE